MKAFVGISNAEHSPTFSVVKGKGATSGTTAQIYAMAQGRLDNEDPTEATTIQPDEIQAEMSHDYDYVALGWADFFPDDRAYTLPLIIKYQAQKIQNTFYRQIKPMTIDPMSSVYPRDKVKMIEQSGNRDGNHAFLHINHIYMNGLYDGRTTPSNDDLRVDRGDGKNEWGHDVTDTVDECITESLRYAWLALSEDIGASAWEDLTDDECEDVRKSLSAFGIPLDGQNRQWVLQSLDELSNRYCGTSGYSVLDGDYETRTPNTADPSEEPSENNRILGGIFQGAATTQNHEIWERILLIDAGYKEEYDGKRYYPMIFWGTPGGGSLDLMYNTNPTQEYGRYHDRDHTLLSTGVTPFTSSISGKSRSWVDVLRERGYRTGMFAQGHSYGYVSYSGVNRKECQRIMKRNENKPDYLGDGYVNSLRIWDNSLEEADQNILLGATDLVKDLYDWTATESTYAGLSAFGAPTKFDAVIDQMTKWHAWGINPDFVGDAEAGTNVQEASYLLVLEAFIQYCIRAGIKIVSHEQLAAFTLDVEYSPANYFPNPTFKTTPKTVLAATNCKDYPDGWNGGVVINEEVDGESEPGIHIDNSGGGTDVTYFTRQYGIKPGDFDLSIWADGKCTLSFYLIRNSHLRNATGSSNYESWFTKNIDKASWAEVTESDEIPDAPLRTYSEPTTPEEVCDQNYFQGYEDKVCGIHIEVVVAAGDEIKLSKPVIQIS